MIKHLKPEKPVFAVDRLFQTRTVKDLEYKIDWEEGILENFFASLTEKLILQQMKLLKINN